MKIFLVIHLVICILTFVRGRLEEGVFRKCKRSSARLERCLTDHVQAIRETLKKGIPDIKFPPLEPYKVQKIENLATVFPLFKVRGYASNVVAHGFGDFKINKFKIHPNGSAELTVVIPKLDIEADYIAEDSQIMLFIPLPDQAGKITATFYDINVYAYMRTSKIYDSGEELEYVRLAYLVTDITFSDKSKFHLAPSRGYLAKASSFVLNFSHKKVLKIVKASIDKCAAQQLKKIVNSVLDLMPLEDVLK